MKVKIKKLNKKAVIPTQAREGDFCYDVVAISEEEVAPNVWRYGLGFAYEIERKPTSWYGPCTGLLGDINLEQIISHRSVKLSLDFRPRSSVWKTGMILSNCVGTLDEFYRGEVMAVFYHVMPNMPRYKVGDKIGQIKLGITIPLTFEVVDDIDMDTERGVGGFGSTDKQVEKAYTIADSVCENSDYSNFLYKREHNLTDEEIIQVFELMYGAYHGEK